VNRQAQAVVMLLLGGAVLKASLTDMYLRYVREGLRPFLIAAGVMLVAAAVMTLWYDIRHGSHAIDHDHGDGEEGKPHREPRIGWLLIAPVLGLLLIAPPALGAYSAGQSGSALGSQRTTDFPPLPDGDPAEISVLDYATRAIYDKGASIGERKVRVSGFISFGPDGVPVLTRMVMSCCAADARPIKIGMSGASPTGVKEDAWVEVTGAYTERTAVDPVNEAAIPFIEVLEWRPIDPPKGQYE
jgi:uncharacterized repeat protein (TIGR03943 family)